MILLSSAFAASVTLNPGDDVATLTASLTAGDEVVFNAGTYPIPSYLDWTGKGTEAAPIRLRAAGGEVILDFSGSYEVAYLHDASWFEIDGLTFVQSDKASHAVYSLYLENTESVRITNCVFGPTGRGVIVTGNNSGLVFEHNEITNVTDGYGISVGCSDASCWTQDSSFTNNWIHDVGGHYSYLFYLANGGQGNVIADNVMYNSTYRGMAVNSTEYGAPNEVRGNAIWNVGGTGLLVRGTSIVQNNVVFDTGEYGLYFGDNDRGTLANAAVSHNTVFGSRGWGVYLDDLSGREGIVFANNAIANTTGYGLYVVEGGLDKAAYVSHNVVSGLVDNFELYTGTEAPYLPGGGDADFVDPVLWDFYPANGSQLVDAADPASAAFVPQVDFNGAPRDGGGPDAGAYERGGDGNPGWVLSEGFKEVGELDDGNGEVVGGGCCGGKAEAEAALLPMGLLAWGWRRRRRRA